MGRRYDIADAQHPGRCPPPSPMREPPHVEQRMVAEPLGESHELQCFPVEVQHRIAWRQRLVGQSVRDCPYRPLHGPQQRGGHFIMGLVVGGLLPRQRIPDAMQPVQRLTHCSCCHLACIGQRKRREFHRVHAACALHQVVRLVDKHPGLPLPLLRQRMQHRRAVVVVVVVGHHHVAPAHQFLREVVGADLVRQGQGAQGGSIPRRGQFQGGGPCGRQPVVEAPGQRAGLAVAGLVGVLTGFVAGLHVEHPQRVGCILCGQLLVHGGQRLQGEAVAGALGRQVKELVQSVAGAGLEHGEKGAQGLADARGRLRQQAAPAGDLIRGAVNGHGQLALTGSEPLHREAQRRQCRIAHLPVPCLAARPGQEESALFLEEGLQCCGAMGLHQHGLFPGADIEVHQSHAQFGQ